MKKIKKISTIFFAVMFTTGFLTTAPSSAFLNNLMNIQITKFETQNVTLLKNLNIAFAQEENDPPPTTPICCSNGETPGADEYCDDDNQCIPMCCTNGTNPNVGYRCDESQCGEDPGGPNCQNGDCTKTKVCTDVNAKNYVDPASRPGLEPGGNCDYIDACCDPKGQNFDPELCQDPHYRHNPDVCVWPHPICCNSGYDNYTSQSDRRPSDVCKYDKQTCSCTTTAGQHKSQCGGGGGDTCEILTEFSVIKSGVAIAGNAVMMVEGTCDEQDRAELEAYLAGRAAADATPETPLNTPIQLDALSEYTVTSKDYCLNILEVQGPEDGYNRTSGGFCCADGEVPDEEKGQCLSAPQCGASSGQSFDAEPTTDFCQNGNHSGVVTSPDTYDWSCSVTSEGNPENSSEVQCSANRLCDGHSCEVCTDLDCGPDDQCKNISGSQNSSYLSTNNLTPDSHGICWNATTGACGSISQIPYVTEEPNTNLCISDASATPVSFDEDTGIYSWNCQSNQYGNNIDPLCQVRQCQGTECQTDQSTGLIKQFKAQPSIVSKLGEGCTLTWESNIDSGISDPEQGCRINGTPVADNNLSGTRVGPGAYSLMCYLGVTFQIKSARCTISPDYKEI